MNCIMIFNYGTSYNLIERRGHTFFLHLGDVTDLIRTIQQECYCINPRKVIKSMSAYTLKELQTISENLNYQYILKINHTPNKFCMMQLVQRLKN